METRRMIRADRGTRLTCRSWPQEAALRMLMNNLDPDVAERPEDLIVYGGTGKAARNWEAFDRLVTCLRSLADEGRAVLVSSHLMSELEGIANRTDFDLKQHSSFSGKSLTYFDEERKTHVVPYVIEPSAGVDRSLLAFLTDAYHVEEVRGEKRVVLRFHPELAPIKIAVLPLLKKREDIVAQAWALRDDLAKRWVTVYDDTAAIGRLYRRQDEVGTPYCVTVDVQTVGDSAKGEVGDGRVTIRDRDSMEQARVPIGELEGVFAALLGGAAWRAVAERYPIQPGASG